jgi:uncharacterized membrane protein YcaP (DUF421 family)
MGDAFQLTMPAWGIVVRTSLVCLALVTLVRVIPKRGVENLSPGGVLALALIGATAADGIQGGTHFVASVLIMIAVIVGLVEYDFPFVLHRVLRDVQTPLVRNADCC